MRKGSHHTEEAKRKMSAAHKGCVAWNKGKSRSDETRCKISESLKGHIPWNKGKKGMQVGYWKGKSRSEQTRKKISEFHKGRKHTAETEKKMSESHKANLPSTAFKKGSIPWNKGKKMSEEFCIKMSQALTGKKLPLNVREKMSKTHKQLCADPNYVRKRIRAIATKPNKLEILFGDLLDLILPNEYKYVGDGQFILAGKCPDFLNVNGQKKLIEVFGDYWHADENPQDRIDLFAEYGYATLSLGDRNQY